MSTTAQQVRAYTGPAILSYGFRPFFLGGAAWAVVTVLLWLPMLAGRLALPSAFSALEWHVHELLYGYVPAVIAGFLLTAIPNWTGRLPVVGTPLLVLFLIWVFGRIAVFVSEAIGVVAAAAIDVSFLLALAVVIAREIIAAGNTKNLKVLAVVGILLAGNVVFHLEAAGGESHGYGARLGIAAVITLIMLIGGRIVPSFTRNWLARQAQGRMPASFDSFDRAAVAISAATLGTWVLLPGNFGTAALAVFAGSANIWRLYRWAGERTWTEPLVAVLHVAYIFVPVGFFLLSLNVFAPTVITSTGALHAWTTGAIGLMTLAVMTRASLGHSGKPLTASNGIQLIYLTAFVAAVARIVAAFDVEREIMLHASALAWVLAFAGFTVIFAPLLVKPKQ